jgi:uncharacterized protein YkwD
LNNRHQGLAWILGLACTLSAAVLTDPGHAAAASRKKGKHVSSAKRGAKPAPARAQSRVARQRVTQPAARPVPFPSAVPNTASQAVSLADMEHSVLGRMNEQRRLRGLVPLARSEDLTRIARTFSRQMATEQFFDHVSPRGDSVARYADQAGIDYRMIGDNLYMCVRMRDPESGAIKGWMESPGHRANALEPGYRETGVGIWKAGDAYYFTQVFKQPW